MINIISGQTAFIVWREAMEAILIVGIIHSFLVRDRRETLPSMWIGVLLGLMLSGALAVTMLTLQSFLQGQGQLWFQVITMLVSSFLMAQMVFWMRRHGSSLKKSLESDLQQAAQKSMKFGVLVITALAVGREGSEAVVYVYSLAVEGGASPASVSVSTFLGVAAAFVMAWLISKGLHLLRRGIFFRLTGWILLISAASLWGSAFGKLVSENVLPGFVDPLWDSSHILKIQSWYGGLLHTVIGYDPRPSLLEVLAYGIFWIAVLFFFNFSTLSQRLQVARES